MFLLLVAAACSRESPAPPVQQPTTTTSAPAITKMATEPSSTRYDDAVRWFRSTPGFHFVLEEGGVRAEGDVSRPTIGAEEVRVIVNGEEWTAKTAAKGVVWERGGKEVAPPEWGNRVFQRVTIAFDPEKSEREAQLIEPKHFRFTDANSHAIHDVHLNDAGQIERITIGSSVSLTLSRQR
jgi:hypothetical protein